MVSSYLSLASGAVSSRGGLDVHYLGELIQYSVGLHEVFVSCVITHQAAINLARLREEEEEEEEEEVISAYQISDIPHTYPHTQYTHANV